MHTAAMPDPAAVAAFARMRANATADQPVGSDGRPLPSRLCQQGHTLTVSRAAFECDVCRTAYRHQPLSLGCKYCNIDICERCAHTAPVCGKNHVLRDHAQPYPWLCDACQSPGEPGVPVRSCVACGYDLCMRCVQRATTAALSSAMGPGLKTAAAETEARSPPVSEAFFTYRFDAFPTSPTRAMAQAMQQGGADAWLNAFLLRHDAGAANGNGAAPPMFGALGADARANGPAPGHMRASGNHREAAVADVYQRAVRTQPASVEADHHRRQAELHARAAREAELKAHRDAAHQLAAAAAGGALAHLSPPHPVSPHSPDNVAGTALPPHVYAPPPFGAESPPTPQQQRQQPAAQKAPNQVPQQQQPQYQQPPQRPAQQQQYQQPQPQQQQYQPQPQQQYQQQQYQQPQYQQPAQQQYQQHYQQQQQYQQQQEQQQQQQQLYQQQQNWQQLQQQQEQVRQQQALLAQQQQQLYQQQMYLQQQRQQVQQPQQQQYRGW